MASPLIDLDELILKCRDEKAKQYIQEAVLCYKSGAFRSAIITTWIAVAFDIIDKIRELSLAGDPEAEKHIKEFDKLGATGDIVGALNFEKRILDVARDNLGLISHLEHIDLKRIQDDRNRCAHPSLTSDGDIFKPMAELARLHISSAVNHLLQYPPAQGKYALERIMNDINSEYFPCSENEALIALKNGPLKKPRTSLVRNLIMVLLKKFLKEDLDYKAQNRIIAALKVIQTMHTSIYMTTNTEKLSDIARSIADNNLSKLLVFIKNCPELWDYLDADVRQRLKLFIKHLPSDVFKYIEHALELKPLDKSVQIRLKSSNIEELSNILSDKLHPKVVDRIIDGYLNSDSYNEANKWAVLIINTRFNFSTDQVRKIVSNMSKNGQILDSFKIKDVIHVLRLLKIIDEDEFETILKENGLEQYAVEKIEDEF